MKANGLEKIFISYSHSDYQKVSLYLEILKKINIDFFIDEEGIVGNDYAKKIMEKLRACELFIVFLSDASLNSLNVQTEISIAFERYSRKENITLLPVYLEEIADLLQYTSCYYIKCLNVINDLTPERYAVFETKIRKIFDLPIEVKKNTPRKNTYYNFSDEKEKSRLELQQQLILGIDLPIYKNIVKGKKQLALLDVGCGIGNSIATRVNSLNKNKQVITKVVGLEYDEQTVDEAKRLHPDFSFYQIDVEDKNFYSELKNICFKENVDKFDVINISLLLLHLENPYKTLMVLRSFLKKDGVIFIRDVDDLFTYGYPDEERLIEKLNNIIEKTETSGYRKSGRRIGLFLKQLGFKYIYRPNLGMSSRDMDYEEKEAFFHMCLSWNIDDIEKMVKKYPESNEWKNYLDWYKENIDHIHELFFDPNFVYNLGTVIFVASDKEIEWSFSKH